MPKYIPALRFSFLTKFYDPFTALILPERRIKCDLLSLMRIQGPDKILDFGCGTGTLLVMGKRSHPDSRFEGLDIDPEVLSIARKKIAQRRMDITLTQYDGGPLPYPHASFTKIVTTLVLHHLYSDQKRSAMKEFFRILSNTGEVFIADFGAPSNLPMALLSRVHGVFEPMKENREGRIPKMMKEAGFIGVQTMKTYNTIGGTICVYSGKKKRAD